MSKEAMKLALEALEKLWNIIDDIDTYGDMAKADEKLYRSLVERRQRTRFEETGISTDGYTLDGGAITAIREALAEQKSGIKQVIELYDSPDQPAQQEPVACIGYWNQKTGAYYKPDQISASHQKLIEDGILRRCYTAPPQRTWVGLTDEEITDIWAGTSPYYHEDDFAKAIEAKLRERNT